MHIRPIKHDELSELLRLYSFLNPEDPPLSEDIAKDAWDTIFADKNLNYFVALIDSKIVASCMLAIIPNLTRGGRPFAVMQNVVTDPAYRGRGIASELLSFANEFAWEQKCYQVLLQTGRPETHDFYRKVGFQDDVKTGFVIKPGVAGNSMARGSA